MVIDTSALLFTGHGFSRTDLEPACPDPTTSS
jgi:hypothetical protein